ncbi:hypothetical protein FVE85_5852 [Porphyridium purpureum]|uniref:Uncharacterized protein n=1 Tax=Porphyridium purpureum TaxID=35688 RepID=A0A5J4Z6I9_PORPP|nr:hypothetical protein FVE85_5852 [Porphyridium purpureum]|eukprot:POR4789..scf295_1
MGWESEGVAAAGPGTMAEGMAGVESHVAAAARSDVVMRTECLAKALDVLAYEWVQNSWEDLDIESFAQLVAVVERCASKNVVLRFKKVCAVRFMESLPPFVEQYARWVNDQSVLSANEIAVDDLKSVARRLTVLCVAFEPAEFCGASAGAGAAVAGTADFVDPQIEREWQEARLQMCALLIWISVLDICAEDDLDEQRQVLRESMRYLDGTDLEHSSCRSYRAAFDEALANEQQAPAALLKQHRADNLKNLAVVQTFVNRLENVDGELRVPWLHKFSDLFKATDLETFAREIQINPVGVGEADEQPSFELSEFEPTLMWTGQLGVFAPQSMDHYHGLVLSLLDRKIQQMRDVAATGGSAALTSKKDFVKLGLKLALASEAYTPLSSAAMPSSSIPALEGTALGVTSASAVNASPAKFCDTGVLLGKRELESVEHHVERTPNAEGFPAEQAAGDHLNMDIWAVRKDGTVRSSGEGNGVLTSDEGVPVETGSQAGAEAGAGDGAGDGDGDGAGPGVRVGTVADSDAGNKSDSKKRKKSRFWTAEEDAELERGLERHGYGRWRKILNEGNFDEYRTPIMVKDRARVLRRQLEAKQHQQQPPPHHPHQ